MKKRAQPSVTFGMQASAPYLKRKEGKEGEKKDALSVLKDEVDHLLVTEYVPAALLVNADLDVLIFRGNIAPYVLPESGLASLNLAKIIRKELRSEVQTIIYRARKENKPVKENAYGLNMQVNRKQSTSKFFQCMLNSMRNHFSFYCSKMSVQRRRYYVKRWS